MSLYEKGSKFPTHIPVALMYANKTQILDLKNNIFVFILIIFLCSIFFFFILFLLH